MKKPLLNLFPLQSSQKEAEELILFTRNMDLWRRQENYGISVTAIFICRETP